MGLRRVGYGVLSNLASIFGLAGEEGLSVDVTTIQSVLDVRSPLLRDLPLQHFRVDQTHAAGGVITSTIAAGFWATTSWTSISPAGAVPEGYDVLVLDVAMSLSGGGALLTAGNVGYIPFDDIGLGVAYLPWLFGAGPSSTLIGAHKMSGPTQPVLLGSRRTRTVQAISQVTAATDVRTHFLVLSGPPGILSAVGY